MTDRDLFKLKENIEDAKNRLAELKGQRKALITQLKEEWGVTSIEEADKKLKALERNIVSLQEERDKGILSLKKMMEDDGH